MSEEKKEEKWRKSVKDDKINRKKREGFERSVRNGKGVINKRGRGVTGRSGGDGWRVV